MLDYGYNSIQVSAPPLAAETASLIKKETFSLLHLFFHSMFIFE